MWLLSPKSFAVVRNDRILWTRDLGLSTSYALRRPLRPVASRWLRLPR